LPSGTIWYAKQAAIDANQSQYRHPVDDEVTTMACAQHADQASRRTTYGGKMARAEPRIIVAAVAIFTALAGLGASIRGLLYDSPSLVRYGAAALVLGVGCFVALLNIRTRDDA
jgi:hypothetical protein